MSVLGETKWLRRHLIIIIIVGKDTITAGNTMTIRCTIIIRVVRAILTVQEWVWHDTRGNTMSFCGIMLTNPTLNDNGSNTFALWVNQSCKFALNHLKQIRTLVMDVRSCTWGRVRSAAKGQLNWFNFKCNCGGGHKSISKVKLDCQNWTLHLHLQYVREAHKRHDKSCLHLIKKACHLWRNEWRTPSRCSRHVAHSEGRSILFPCWQS